MLRSVFIVVALATLVQNLIFAKESAVTVLNKENFDKVIGGDKLVLVKFFAPWCGHCKAMKGAFEDAAEELKGKAVLADLDATVEKDLAEKHGIRGFPTLKLFSDGELLSDYKGGRDKKSLVNYIERASLPSIEELKSKDDVTTFLKKHEKKIKFVGVKLDKNKSKFKSLSMTMRDNLPDDLVFASVSDPSLFQSTKSDLKEDQVLVIREDNTEGVFTGDEDVDLEKFVKSSSVPLYGELTRDNAAIYTELPHPIYVIFQDPAKKLEKVESDAIEMAKKYRGSNKIAFCWVNSVDLKSFQEYVGLKDKEPPVLIYSFEKDVKYLMNQDYSKENVNKFVQDFVEGKLSPTKKSAPIPEENNDPVKIVVGDTWKSIVEDSSKDVLIEQYAPWCGHCKRLAPILDEVAKDLSSVDTLIIAKMDATANDAPQEYKAQGFPALHFFPAGEEKPVQYQGGRDKKSFIEFFQKHATHKFEVPEPSAEKAAEGEAKLESAEQLEKGDSKAEEKEQKEEL